MDRRMLATRPVSVHAAMATTRSRAPVDSVVMPTTGLAYSADPKTSPFTEVISRQYPRSFFNFQRPESDMTTISNAPASEQSENPLPITTNSIVSTMTWPTVGPDSPYYASIRHLALPTLSQSAYMGDPKKSSQFYSGVPSHLQAVDTSDDFYGRGRVETDTQSVGSNRSQTASNRSGSTPGDDSPFTDQLYRQHPLSLYNIQQPGSNMAAISNTRASEQSHSSIPITTNSNVSAMTWPTAGLNSTYYTGIKRTDDTLTNTILKDTATRSNLASGVDSPTTLQPLAVSHSLPTVIDLRKPPPPLSSPYVVHTQSSTSVPLGAYTRTPSSTGNIIPVDSSIQGINAYQGLQNAAVQSAFHKQTVPSTQHSTLQSGSKIQLQGMQGLIPTTAASFSGAERVYSNSSSVDAAHVSQSVLNGVPSFHTFANVPGGYKNKDVTTLSSNKTLSSSESLDLNKMFDPYNKNVTTKAFNNNTNPAQDTKEKEKSLRHAFMRAVHRQGLDNLEFANMVEIGESMNPDELLPLVQHGLAIIEPQYFRKIMKSRDSCQEEIIVPPDVSQPPPNICTELAQDQMRSTPPEVYPRHFIPFDNTLSAGVFTENSHSPVCEISHVQMATNLSSLQKEQTVHSPLNVHERKVKTSRFGARDSDVNMYAKVPSRDEVKGTEPRKPTDTNSRGSSQSSSEHSHSSQMSRSPKLKSRSQKYKDRPRSRSRSPRKRDSYSSRKHQTRRYDDRNDCRRSDERKSDYRDGGSRRYSKDYSRSNDKARDLKSDRDRDNRRHRAEKQDVKPTTCASNEFATLTAQTPEDEIKELELLEQELAAQLIQSSAQSGEASVAVCVNTDPSSAAAVWYPSPQPQAVESPIASGSMRWSNILMQLLHQLQRVGPELLVKLGHGEAEGAEALFSLFDDDIRGALPQEAQEQAEFLNELHRVFSNFAQANDIDGYDRARSGNKRVGRFEEGGPQAKRRHEENHRDGLTADGKWRCHMCSMSYDNIGEFDAHMLSDSHRMRNDAFSRMHVQQTEHQIQRMHATQYLKQIENSDSDKCNICMKKLLVPYEQHCLLQDHQAKDELNRSKQNKDTAIKTPATVKTNAKPATVKTNEKPATLKTNEKPASNKRNEKPSTYKTETSEKKKLDTAKNLAQNDIKIEKKDDVKLETPTPEVEINEDTLYNPDVAMGQDHVIAVKGFFCKLCHKFYRHEDLAKNIHCKSEKHFEKYQEHCISQRQDNDSTLVIDKIDVQLAEVRSVAEASLEVEVTKQGNTDNGVEGNDNNNPTAEKARTPTARRGRRK